MREHEISLRRACRLAGVDHKTVRRDTPPDIPEIRAEMKAVAHKRRRFGYTQALLSAALPLQVDKVHEPIVLCGEVPSPINPPSGCSFHPRCPKFLGNECETTSPVQQISGDKSHVVSCHAVALDREKSA